MMNINTSNGWISEKYCAAQVSQQICFGFQVLADFSHFFIVLVGVPEVERGCTLIPSNRLLHVLNVSSTSCSESFFSLTFIFWNFLRTFRVSGVIFINGPFLLGLAIVGMTVLGLFFFFFVPFVLNYVYK
jgi:hypothetical protein